MGGCLSGEAIDDYGYNYPNNSREAGAVDYNEHDYGNNTRETWPSNNSDSSESDSNNNSQELEENESQDEPEPEPEPEPLAGNSFNWSNKGVFWDIEKQEDDLCWLNAIVDSLEAKYAITHEDNDQIKLSKQELLDNYYNYTPSGSHMGRYVAIPDDVLEWIRIHGLSLEEDYGSGYFSGSKEEPKCRKPGCQIFGLSGISGYGINQEDKIMEALEDGPGVALMKYDTGELNRIRRDPTRIYTLPREGSFMNPQDILYRINHSVVLSGYDNSDLRKAYWIRDSMLNVAPNGGHYRVTRASSVQYNEVNVLIQVLFPVNVWLDIPDDEQLFPANVWTENDDDEDEDSDYD